MNVEVRLFASLRNDRFKKKVFDLPDGARLGDLIETVGIEKKEVSLRLINGCYSQMEDKLSDGDAVSLFPNVAGG